jgi:hypothetical protein
MKSLKDIDHDAEFPYLAPRNYENNPAENLAQQNSKKIHHTLQRND